MSTEKDEMKKLIDSVMQDQSIVEDFDELLFSGAPSLEEEARHHPLYLAVKLGLDTKIYDNITHNGKTFTSSDAWDAGVIQIIQDYRYEPEEDTDFDGRQPSLVVSELEGGKYSVAIWMNGMSTAGTQCASLQEAVASMKNLACSPPIPVLEISAVPRKMKIRVGQGDDGAVCGWVHQDLTGHAEDSCFTLAPGEQQGMERICAMIDSHLEESLSYQNWQLLP